uniref:Uncharacterized protein n=1 Tax=uncultured prokaryote TaxID=198431 RepID=A0A0H5Q6B5_9ZZZZ|nr:hypothetical protein [uncultured prokaryote]
MTKAQIILKKWIDKNFENVEIEFPTDSSATIKDKKGETMNISLNLYCDILETDSGKILAISDLPHDCITVGNKIPTTWKELPYPAK